MKKIYFIIAALFISVAAFSQPANDLPCAATPLTLNVPVSDDNTTATAEGVPAAPACWSVAGGTYNTLWYQVVCPASGNLKVKTVPLASGNPLQNTQIAVYSGACGGLTLIVCNDNAPSCGTYTQQNSEVSLTGLTAGATYFIRVDGRVNAVGQYQVLAIDGSGSFPLVPGQDCAIPFQLCNSTTTIGNPGFQVIGGVCDHNGTNNCTSGEANSIWYNINIGVAGNLMFDIVPNDYGNPNPITGVANPGYSGVGSETDYDWVLWKTAGAGATTCALISSSGGGGDTRCNFDPLGVTGLFTGGNSPPAYPGFNNAYELPVAVAAGDQFVLVIQNFSNSTSGFTVQFPVGTPVTFNPTVVIWTGGANTTNWNTSLNWGGCNVPTCAGPSFDAIISSAAAVQPVLTAPLYSVRNLTINAGASLTVNAGTTLQICGDFINNGNLNCLPGSTIEFVQGANQNLTGSFTGGNAFSNFTVNKTGGSVLLNNNIDVGANLTTSNILSILNTNDRIVRVGGNFTNFSGNTTFTNTGATTGTLEFYGTGAQNYSQGLTQLDLNNVIMNNTGAGVTLLTNMFVKATTGTLTFTDGRIHTNAFRVDVANTTAGCVTVGTATSYVNGNLWRSIAAGGGAYNFPVGTATLYERALVNIPGANTYTRLQSRFDPWPGAPNVQGGTECTATYSLPSENMGFWTITQTGTNTGTYNMTLFANGATNTAGANGWTVEKATTVAGPWTLNGTCAASTATVVNRNGMSGFSVFAVAQAPTPLPVQLTEFTGHGDGNTNYLTWTTESETNNSHFSLLKSADGLNYSEMERVGGSNNSNTEKHYSAVDENPFGITYYILRQVDYNGEFTEFGPITISNSNVDEFTVHNVYPNPAKESFFIDVFSKNEMLADIFIYDSFGKLMYSRPATINGLSILEIQSAGWASGIYTIKIENETHGYQFIRRVVIGK